MSDSLRTEFAAILTQRLAPTLLFARACSPASDAEEIAQEAFLRLWVRMKEDAPPKNPAAWLFRVVRNLAADGARRHRRERSAAERLAVERSAWFEPPPETSDSAEPLTAALEQLAPELREVVVAKIWGELTFDEIAEITGTPKSSVFDRYRKALEVLRTAIKKEKTDEPS